MTISGSILGPRDDISAADLVASQGYRVVTGEPATDQPVYSGRDWRSAFRAFDAVLFSGVLHHIAAGDFGRVRQDDEQRRAGFGMDIFIQQYAETDRILGAV